jgi:lysyl-tRNA synthetase class 2
MTKKIDNQASSTPLESLDHTATSSQEHQVRLSKVEKLASMGAHAWPAGNPTTATCAQIVDEYKEGIDSPVYAVAGRVVTMREHGKTLFATIQDSSGKLQVYCRSDVLGQELFDFIKHMIDLGDIIWVQGTSFKTKTGEITLRVDQCALVSKSLHPLPEKFHGLTDTETKYRQRYLDLIVNPESRERFKKRSEIVRQMRQFMDTHHFIEVETPMLHPIPGGAIAKPFITHHNALGADLYLRIAPELYLKRLVIGGLDRVYEINRCFRNEGISTKHNPEFTTIEFYAAYLDYKYMMNFVENMIKQIVSVVCSSAQVPYGDYLLDFAQPFERLSMRQAVVKYGGCTNEQLEPGAIDALIKKHHIKLTHKDVSWGIKLSLLFEELVESKLIQPTFITEFPVEVSPLAKRNAENSAIVDRFELFMAGMELSNGFNELNDPFDQAARFAEQVKEREHGDQEAHYYDADYIQALEHALPPTVGVGIGIDRLTMLLTNAPSIRDVILFPTLKRK